MNNYIQNSLKWRIPRSKYPTVKMNFNIAKKNSTFTMVIDQVPHSEMKGFGTGGLNEIFR